MSTVAEFIWKNAMQKASPCGANAPGGGGFIGGNTCASSSGSTGAQESRYKYFEKSEGKHEFAYGSNESDLAEIAELIGLLNGDPSSVIELVGSFDDSTSEITTMYDTEDIYIDTEDGFESRRRIVMDAGELVIHNQFLEVFGTGEGMGTEILARQIQAARNAGVSKLRTEAARAENYNGYYTWARLGYDAKLPDYAKQEFPKLDKISDLMMTEKGRSWWKKNGKTIDMDFDLDPNSRSSKIFESYLSAKGIL